MTENHYRVLVADDLDLETSEGKSRTQAVTTHAAWIAKRLEAQLDLLYVKDLKSYPSDQPYLKNDITKYFTKREHKLQELSKALKVSGLCLVVQGSPVQEILKFARKQDAPEMIVVGTHGRTGPARLFLGSVSEEIVRNSAVPVMTIGPNVKKAKTDVRGPIHILLATDLGPNSKEAEEYAVGLCKKLDAKLVLFHCLSDNFAFTQSAFVDPLLTLEMLTSLQEEKKENLGALETRKAEIESTGVQCEIRYDQKSRTAGEAILKEAKRGISLVVMGTHGRNLFASAFLGSTAREVILESPVPVISVKSRK